jgi:hypothetical protein
VVELPAKRVRYTRACPACESGMDAPGIRQNAACRRAFERGSSPSVEPVPMPQDPEQCFHGGFHYAPGQSRVVPSRFRPVHFIHGRVLAQTLALPKQLIHGHHKRLRVGGEPQALPTGLSEAVRKPAAHKWTCTATRCPAFLKCLFGHNPDLVPPWSWNELKT